MSVKLLRKFILESIINELDIEQIAPQSAEDQRSSHVLKTFSLDGEDYYLKFSDEELFEDGGNPSLQVLNEHLAYNIYSLYPGVRIPSKIELVYDKTNQQVGIATASVKGSVKRVNPNVLGKSMSAGVFVDIFLANWDAVAHGNVLMTDDQAAVRIDPGGSLGFRARGARKGKLFGQQAKELETMLDPEFGGSGLVFQYSDLKEAAREFFGSSIWCNCTKD
jgi:hypothetical protein